MNFVEARAYARSGLHIRRLLWPVHQWISYVRGVWWFQDGTERRVVETTAYSEADLRALDWTSIPAALRECQVPAPGGGSGSDDPGTSPGGGTGGGPIGNPPSGGGGGDPFPPGGKPGSPGAPGGVNLPQPPSKGTIEVVFAGVHDDAIYHDLFGSGYWQSPPTVNQSHTLAREGEDVWKLEFTDGVHITGHQGEWLVRVNRLFHNERRPQDDTFGVFLSNTTTSIHPGVVFQSADAKKRRRPSDNMGGYGGTATVY